MPASSRAENEHSVVGVIRHWLTGTFAGRVLLLGIGVKLLAKLTGQGAQTAPLHLFDTLADVALVVGAVLLLRRLFADVRGVLLWRVRRKLTLSYIFIGFVPVLLVIIFFLVSGLILFFNVSQYVAAARIETLVDQAEFLAESGAIGLQGSTNVDELRQRLTRRQAGAARSYPFVSYAIVPAAECGHAPASSNVPAGVTAGPWQHVDPPDALPAWVDCRERSGLVAYTETKEGTLSEGEPLDARVAARAVTWPDAGAGAYALVVDVPLSSSVLARMRDDTGIDFGAGDVSTLAKCVGLPLSGRTIEARPARSRATGGNVLTRPLDWVTFLQYVDWSSGELCRGSIGIHMSIAEMYRRIATTPADVDINSVLIAILAIVGILFLLIQIAAFIMGLALARSITGSVHELFAGTERVRQGDFAHTISVSSRDQLGELAESFNSMTRSIGDLLRQKAEKERMEQELRIARDIQMSLLPHEQITVPGLAVTAHCEPAREVGGDYYDYMNIGGERLGLLIADVAGKGTSAALYMAELKGLMLSLSQLHSSPRQLLIDANRIISRHLDSKSFITITYAVVDVNRRTLTHARAGHCPLIYVPGPYAPSRAAQVLVPDGLVLGLQLDDDGRRFSQLLEEMTLPLGTGDVFLFYTDGLTEAMDEDGNCFGDARLSAVVQEHADAPFEELRDTILREIAAFSGPAAQHDDMTMLLLKVDEVGARGAVISQAVH